MVALTSIAGILICWQWLSSWHEQEFFLFDWRYNTVTCVSVYGTLIVPSSLTQSNSISMSKFHNTICKSNISNIISNYLDTLPCRLAKVFNLSNIKLWQSTFLCRIVKSPTFQTQFQIISYYLTFAWINARMLNVKSPND